VSASLFTPRGVFAATTWADRTLCVGLIAVSVVLGGLARAPHDRGAVAVVTVGREQVAALPLDQDVDTVVRGRHGDVHLAVRDGAVRVTSSSCRNKVCVGMGSKRRRGEIIACVPNELVVRIVGGEPAPDVPDAVSR
jgi:hypothetical protein